MKKVFKYVMFVVGAAGILASCNEKKWLTEEPLDFLSPDYGYEKASQYNMAINHLYDRYRDMAWNIGDDQRQSLWWGDLSYGGYDWNPPAKYNNWAAWLIPTAGLASDVWHRLYTIIGDANRIIWSADNVPNELTDADKAMIKAEASFFRGLAYARLGNLYGGVPIAQVEPPSSPKEDYVRSTRAETYGQARTDLETAAAVLPDIDKTDDGRVSKQMAQHMLGEVYIALAMWDEAITTLGAVIDYPAMGLMTERFGTRAGEPGDVYWDLFRLNNQNRSSGNRESLWVLQYDYQSKGSTYSLAHSRQVVPGYWSATVAGKNAAGETHDANGNRIKVPAFRNTVNADGWTAEKGGRGIGSMRGTEHFFTSIWGEDFDRDIRNSSYNIQRDFRIDNPAADGYGEWILADGWYPRFPQSVNEGVANGVAIPAEYAGIEPRIMFPSVQKFSRTGNYPTEAYVRNSDGSLRVTALGEHILSNSGSPNLSYTSLKDEYAFRLAETYLLRAEAHLGKGQADLAAADINALRGRAGATPATAAQIDIDYILDERMRELYYEEIRIFTLCRLGKFVERTKRYNPFHGSIRDHHNLWPIPFNEIQRNILAPIEQNPGY